MVSYSQVQSTVVECSESWNPFLLNTSKLLSLTSVQDVKVWHSRVISNSTLFTVLNSIVQM